jgi:hypothetical protein
MLNNLKNIVGVIFSPSKTFQSIKEKRRLERVDLLPESWPNL